MVAADKNPRLGIGLYSYADAARIMHIPASSLQRWIKPNLGLIHRELPLEEKTLTFAELIELHFVKMFREHGVKLETILKTAKAAHQIFDKAYPLSVQRFDTDGNTIFATMRRESDGKEFLEDIARGQLVFKSIVKPFFKKLEYSNNNWEVARYWPLERKGGVVLDPQRKFGKPLDNESGIPTDVLYQDSIVNADATPAEIANWYGISTKSVINAIKYEQSLLA